MGVPREILQSPLISPFSSKTNHLSIGQFQDIYSVMDDIIDNLDTLAIRELTGGNEGDIEGLFTVLQDEVASVLASSDKVLDTSRYGYLDKFSTSVEETMRSRSLNYFILSCLPDFTLAAHNIEWGNLAQIYRLLNILAARDHCFDPRTEVMMYDGSIKSIRDINVGDELMGPDSKPRVVLNIHSGIDDMYRINQSRGDSYVVNSNHTLSTYKKWGPVYGTKHNPIYKSRLAELKDINIKRFITGSRDFKYLHKGYKVAVQFPHKKIDINPYYLGLWLGDGTQSKPNQINTVDGEIIEFLNQYSAQLGLTVSSCEISRSLVGRNTGRGNKNILNKKFEKYQLTIEKYIPDAYIYTDIDTRLSILGGLIDSDGHLTDNQIYISQSIKHERLINDIQRLCLTLGLNCEKKYFDAKLNNNIFPSIQLKIGGEKLLQVPGLLQRKKVIDTGKSNSQFRRPKYYYGDNINYDISNISTISVDYIGQGPYIGFELTGDRRFVLKDGTVAHNSKSYTFSFAYPLWQMYRYRKWSPQSPSNSKELAYAGEGMLVTNEYRLGTEFLSKIKEEIEYNDILKERLYPDSTRDGWGKEKIVCRNGAKLYVRSANSKIRGLHPTWTVLDDFLNESSLYSQEQRDKYWNMFVAVILPALSPGGQLIVVGTPFFELDLYGQLKKIWRQAKDKGESLQDLFRTFEFPAIFPDGTILFPQRHTYESIMAKKATLGPMIFSREIMVSPITDDATLFPYSTLNKAIVGEQDRDIITTLDSSKRKFKAVLVGCDFAISSSIGSDYSVFTVGGVDEMDRIHILSCWRRRGKKFAEQIAILRKMNRDFKPDLFIVETNGMQEIFLQELQTAGLPVVGDFTGNDKKSLYQGVPSLAILFEQNKIKFPYGTARAKEMTDIYFSELNSITFIQDKGKLESTTQHDDTAMSLWQLIKGVRRSVKTFDFSFISEK